MEKLSGENLYLITVCLLEPEAVRHHSLPPHSSPGVVEEQACQAPWKEVGAVDDAASGPSLHLLPQATEIDSYGVKCCSAL